MSRFGFLLFRDEVGALSESESSSESASSALARATLRTRTGSVKRFEGVRCCGFGVRLEWVGVGEKGLVSGGGCMELKGDKVVTYHFTHWASNCLLIHTVGSGELCPTCIDHTNDGLFFKAMRTFFAANRILHGE